MSPKEFIESLYDVEESEVDDKVREIFDWFKEKSGKGIVDGLFERISIMGWVDSQRGKDPDDIEPPEFDIKKQHGIEGLEEAVFNAEIDRIEPSILFSLMCHIWHMGPIFPRYNELKDYLIKHFTKTKGKKYANDLFGGMEYKG